MMCGARRLTMMTNKHTQNSWRNIAVNYKSASFLNAVYAKLHQIILNIKFKKSDSRIFFIEFQSLKSLKLSKLSLINTEKIFDLIS